MLTGFESGIKSEEWLILSVSLPLTYQTAKMASNSGLEKKIICNKVILVEDSKAEADLTKIVYSEQALPIEIVHCQNGEEFLNFLNDADEQEICYVLLDLNMPRVSGYDVLTALAADEKWKNLVIIIFSSSINEKDVARCYELGAKAYVAKPFELSELDRTILSIHDFWGNTNVKPSSN